MKRGRRRAHSFTDGKGWKIEREREREHARKAALEGRMGKGRTRKSVERGKQKWYRVREKERKTTGGSVI